MVGFLLGMIASTLLILGTINGVNSIFLIFMVIVLFTLSIIYYRLKYKKMGQKIIDMIHGYTPSYLR